MKRLAACPNVVSKLSGLGTFLRRNDPAHVAFIAKETLALFGAERCLFGSNFPIEKLWTTYASLVQAHRAGVPATDHDQIFNRTARRVYRLGE
jgi:predicted TIM-barrel fold metal-dependent hydrolase